MTEPSGPWGRTAAFGVLTWLAWALAVGPSWTSCLLLLSPFVLVPLGLGLAARPDAGPMTPALHRLRPALWPAAALAALAFVPEPGLRSAALTVPWLVVGVVIGLIGAGRFLSRRRLHPTMGVDAGLAFLAIGAVWLTISRAGANPLGFSDAIVELTAVHFHYAGFALPIVAGLTAFRARCGPLVPLWVTFGVPLTALGITAGGAVEWVAATVLATGGLAAAATMARSATTTPPVGRGLLVVAALALGAGMVLALGWACSTYFGWAYLDLDGMARWHGTLNAIGFGFAALTGLHLAPPTPATPEHLALHLGHPRPSTLVAIAAQARHHEPTSDPGLLLGPPPIGYRYDRWTGPLPHGCDRARHALEHWVGHRAAGITVAEPAPPIEVGATVTISIPVGPLHVTATARIIDVVDEPDRYGFTYTTLPHHPEDGEESFVVTRSPDGAAHYAVTAIWRTGTYAARVLPPLTRFLQRRAVGRYLTGVAGWQPESTRVAGR